MKCPKCSHDFTNKQKTHLFWKGKPLCKQPCRPNFDVNPSCKRCKKGLDAIWKKENLIAGGISAVTKRRQKA